MWAGRSTGSARTARETARDVARHGHTALAAGMGKGEWDDEGEGGAGGDEDAKRVDEEAEEGQTSDMSGSSFPKNPNSPIQNDITSVRTSGWAKKNDITSARTSCHNLAGYP